MKQINQVLFISLLLIQTLGQNNEKEQNSRGKDNDEVYRIENAKFVILLIFLALICRYLYTRKVIQRIGELIISLKILHQSQAQQPIPENDEYYKKGSIVKQVKKVMKYLKSKFNRINDSQVDVSKKYSQFDMEESI